MHLLGPRDILLECVVDDLVQLAAHRPLTLLMFLVNV